MTNSTKRLGAAVCAMGGILAWAYWPTFREIADRWSTSPIYSHGYLVPLFAGFLLWQRRRMIAKESFRPSWWGVPWMAVGASLHVFGAYFFIDWFSAASILPILVGLVLSLGGGNLLRWSWPAIAFLVFMLPLPFRVETSLAHPLQHLATLASTYVLQTAGFAAVAEGNIIVMEKSRIGVIEACNGLGMLVTFFALATAVAILMRGRIADKVIIVLSALPIALLANVIRITATSMLTESAGAELTDLDFDMLAGWIMMPIALALLWTEKVMLNKLLIEQSEGEMDFSFAEVGTAKQSCSA